MLVFSQRQMIHTARCDTVAIYCAAQNPNCSVLSSKIFAKTKQQASVGSIRKIIVKTIVAHCLFTFLRFSLVSISCSIKWVKALCLLKKLFWRTKFIVVSFWISSTKHIFRSFLFDVLILSRSVDPGPQGSALWETSSVRIQMQEAKIENCQKKCWFKVKPFFKYFKKSLKTWKTNIQIYIFHVN